MSDIKSLYKSLELDEKRKLRIKIARIISKYGEKGVKRMIGVGKDKKALGEVVKALRFKPEQALTLENYNMAMILYKVRPSISNAFLAKYIKHILFDYCFWIKSEHEKVLRRLIKSNKMVDFPTRKPSTRLQMKYLLRMYKVSWSLTLSKKVEMRYLKHIRSRPKLADLFEAFMYREWVKERQKDYYPHISNYFSITLHSCGQKALEKKPIDRYLFLSLLRGDHEPFLDAFKDISVIRSWPLGDRKTVIAILFDLTKGIIEQDCRAYRELLQALGSLLSKDSRALTKFFKTSSDVDFLSKSWPQFANSPADLTGFFTYFKIDLKSLRLETAYLLKKGNEETLKFIWSESPTHVKQLMESANIKQLGRLVEIYKEDNTFYRLLENQYPSILRAVIRYGYIDVEHFNKFGINVNWETDKDTDLDIVMEKALEKKIDVGRALNCLALGSLSKLAIPIVEKELYKHLGDVQDMAGISEYFCGNTSPTMEDLSNIPAAILSDNPILCKYIVKQAWDLMKNMPRKKRTWPLSQTVLQAILFIPVVDDD